MKIIYCRANPLNTDLFKLICKQNDIAPESCVFIFPGNEGHHTTSHNLFSIKDGGGLARVSWGLGQSGFPTLSLPTTGMRNWHSSAEIQKIVKTAICDIYKALGAGFSLFLPVRQKTNSNYFATGLKDQRKLEPSFWGGIDRNSNPSLAAHYITVLDKLGDFINAESDNARAELFEDGSSNIYYQAYIAGRRMREDADPWLQPRIMAGSANPVTATPVAPKHFMSQPQPSSSAQVSKNEYNYSYPRSYQRFYNNGDNALNCAKALLNDYTKNNSWFRRILTLHWNRHHVKAVNEIISNKSAHDIQSIDELLLELNKLKNDSSFNQQGSLAKRIEFINNKKNTKKLS